ncbi:uncharacterized protein LOC124146849 [Haliotis rufescens]|uniref:uncharacterized protein LOC124146849 n=1 Tax=Haliotis rufescens TaxID=6454 RepID=UPI00201F9830|nr:uncharacterized protein LOC124146849 [Haliotis rufescens]
MRLYIADMDTLLLVILVFWIVHLTDSQSQKVIFSTSSTHTYHSLFDHGVKQRSHTSLKFKVKACGDAHVALQTLYQNSDTQMYEIVLGGWSNSKSVFRRCAQCDSLVEYSGAVVSCSQYKQFWTSWGDGTVKAGRGGTVGQDEILSYTDPNPHAINYFAAATGFGSSGEWIFDLCESSLQFKFLQNNAKYDGGTIRDSKTVLSRADCSVNCFSSIWCQGFSHDSSTNTCNMFDDIPPTTALTSATGWETWIVSL